VGGVPRGQSAARSPDGNAIDFSHTSNIVGALQQASGKGLVYLAAESLYPSGVGSLVPKDSPMRTVRDLQGKRV
jgi:sulfonate transport system substrate-binding protein